MRGGGGIGMSVLEKNQLFATLEYVPNENMRRVPFRIIMNHKNKNISITQEISNPLYTRKTNTGVEGERMNN